MFNIVPVLSIAAFIACIANIASAREQITIVGSSTVYPFTTAVAEEFGRKGQFRTPIVESTGTGGGFKLFCAGLGDDTPDIENASRPIKDSERALCKKNGVTAMSEVKIGYDGIILANSLKAPHFNLKLKHLFLALARDVPKGGKLVPNPYQKWNEIDPTLPALPISVYGLPPTSGTRDTFVELVLVKSCENIAEFKAAYPDDKKRTKICGAIREDGKYIEAGENGNLVVEKLIANPDTLGIFGYSYLDENREKVQASMIEGKPADTAHIVDGSYPISRSLFLYVKNDHIGKVPGITEFLASYTSKEAMGPEGYLAAKGLIPLTEKERQKSKKEAGL